MTTARRAMRVYYYVMEISSTDTFPLPSFASLPPSLALSPLSSTLFLSLSLVFFFQSGFPSFLPSVSFQRPLFLVLFFVPATIPPRVRCTQCFPHDDSDDFNERSDTGLFRRPLPPRQLRRAVRACVSLVSPRRRNTWHRFWACAPTLRRRGVLSQTTSVVFVSSTTTDDDFNGTRLLNRVSRARVFPADNRRSETADDNERDNENGYGPSDTIGRTAREGRSLKPAAIART